MPSQQAGPPVIAVKDVVKTYLTGATEIPALRKVSLTIQRGEYVALMGKSGSGKSTLMNLLGLLDRPTSGSYCLNGIEAITLKDAQLAYRRNKEIGFVFQQFNLLPRVTAQHQVELPLFYAGVNSRQAAKLAFDALVQVGLADRSLHYPEELSGGQKQRVAIARALVNSPALLLADEPTGALDTDTGLEILRLFDEMHKRGTTTLIVVTHDEDVARQAQRIIYMKDGQIVRDEKLH